MNKEYYSIGEVSKIMNVSIQTLRYYNSISLLEPAYINQDTGYRYYTKEQFPSIDRIRDLQNLGMSLADIKNVIVNNDTDSLLSYLDQAKRDCITKMKELTEGLEEIEHYERYFRYYYPEPDEMGELVSIRHYPVRYLKLLNADFNRGSSERVSEEQQIITSVLDYDKMLKHQIEPQYQGIIRDEKWLGNPDEILEIPEGDYYCFMAKIGSKQWSGYVVKQFFYGETIRPSFVLAREYERYAHEYSNAAYEVQVLIPREMAQVIV